MELLARDHEGSQVSSVDSEEHHSEHRPDVGHEPEHTVSFLNRVMEG